MAEKKKFNLEDITAFSLFVPKGKISLVSDYPELKKNRYLDNLRREVLLFCWYLGCEGSPAFDYYNSGDAKDKKAALIFAKEHSDIKMADHEWDRVMKELVLPANYTKGIQEFNSFKVGPRVRMMRMVEHMLDNFEKVIRVDINSPEFHILDKDGNSLGEKDYGKVKQYTDTCINIRNKFSEILAQAEQGFGISDVKEDEKNEVGQSFLDLKHEINKK
jgi:hypothetical protein